MSENNLLFTAEHISKSFGVTKALVDVKLELKKGEVLGLVGENGSGKSTLTTILSAVQCADTGTMSFEGKLYAPRSSVEANELGICMILQENGTFGQLSVAKNIFIGREQLFAKKGIVSNRKMNQEARKALDRIHAEHISEKVLVSSLNFEDKKLVELARAMWTEPKILVADETTTALSRVGRSILYGIMERMKEEGKSVIFISHDLEELMERCDRLMVLRDGHYIVSLERAEYEENRIKSLMVGRKTGDNYYRTDLESCKNEEVVLQVGNVSTEFAKDISFSLHRGEILGFGGLADCGIHEIGRIAYGLVEPEHGAVTMADGSLIENPRRAMANKIGYMSKNRDKESLMLASSIRENICLASYKKLRKMGFVWPREEKRFSSKLSDELEIKMRDSSQFVLELSGGNKQKVVIAKWLGFGADILILDCPTRGIDIGVKANIYSLMSELRQQGISMILISEELPELIGMSDRILIMKDGCINGEFKREDNLSETKLIEYMV